MSDDTSSKWRAIYNQSDQVRRLADKIHNSRMLAPPACDQCIEMAVEQLKVEADEFAAAIFPPTRSK